MQDRNIFGCKIYSESIFWVWTLYFIRTPSYINIASPTGRILVRLRPDVLTTPPHTNLYLRSDFILMCFGNTVKTKKIQFLSCSRKIRPFWKKIPIQPTLLGFINQKMIGKCRFFYPNRPSP